MSSRSVHAAELRVVAQRPGRFAGESQVVLATPHGARAHGLWSPRGARPWADLDIADPRALPAIAAALGPGASIMVAYGADETERALRRRAPPAATELGIALLRAGCRWFKDWYFAEGGREGHTKLQGELPRDATQRARAEEKLRAELEVFLACRGGDPDDVRRARAALAVLDGGRPRCDTRTFPDDRGQRQA